MKKHSCPMVLSLLTKLKPMVRVVPMITMVARSPKFFSRTFCHFVIIEILLYAILNSF